MARIKNIGAPLYHYHGKTLFEIMSNLKNFGKFRVFGRYSWDKYSQKSYIILTRGRPEYNSKEFDVGQAYGFIVFRNFSISEEKPLEEAYFPDWYLIPKHKENSFIISQPPPKLVAQPKYIEIPPLLNFMMIRNFEKSKIHDKIVKIENIIEKPIFEE